MRLVPHRDQVAAALADVFGVENAAPKCVSRVQGAFELDLDVAIQVYIGRVNGDAGAGRSPDLASRQLKPGHDRCMVRFRVLLVGGKGD
jgi:hypothetical protein